MRSQFCQCVCNVNNRFPNCKNVNISANRPIVSRKDDRVPFKNYVVNLCHFSSSLRLGDFPMTGAQAEGHSSPGLTMVFPQNREIRLNGNRFKTISDRYCRMEPLPPVIDSCYDVSDDVTADFTRYCDGEDLVINEGNFNDLWALAEEWDMSDLIKKCKKFANTYFEDDDTVGLRVLTAICHRIELMGETAAFEKILHEKLPLFANEIPEDKEMCDLVDLIDFAVIVRVFQRNNCSLARDHLEEVFPFMLYCLDLFPGCGSMLFENADLRKLDQRQMTELLRNDKLDHHYLTSSYVCEFNRGFRTRTFCTIGTCIVVLCFVLMMTTLCIRASAQLQEIKFLEQLSRMKLKLYRRQQLLERCQRNVSAQGQRCVEVMQSKVAEVLRDIAGGNITLTAREKDMEGIQWLSDELERIQNEK